MRFVSVWFVIFFVLTCSCVWAGARFVSKFIMYKKFSLMVEGESTNFQVISLGEEKHHICVDYKFRIGEQTYHGQYVKKTPSFLSADAARLAIAEMEKGVVNVWCWFQKSGASGALAPISILDNPFPKSEFLRFACVVGIAVYFALLRRYLTRFKLESVS